MRKKWFKKGSAVLLAAAMVLSLFPGMKGTLATVQAAENETPTSGYWTDVAGLKNFSLDEANDTEGKKEKCHANNVTLNEWVYTDAIE